jgi:hypothetical protein
MSDFFGRKKKANEKHESELKARLASKLQNYDSADDKSVTEFTDIDFGKGKKRVEKIIFTDGTWVNTNPSKTGKK